MSNHMQLNSTTRMSATCFMMFSQIIDKATFTNKPRHFSVLVVRWSSIVQGWRKSGSWPFDHKGQLILFELKHSSGEKAEQGKEMAFR
jgi:hypothetical protein